MIINFNEFQRKPKDSTKKVSSGYFSKLSLIQFRKIATGTITAIITWDSVESFFKFFPWPFQTFIKSLRLTVTHNDFLVSKTPFLIGIYLIPNVFSEELVVYLRWTIDDGHFQIFVHIKCILNVNDTCTGFPYLHSEMFQVWYGKVQAIQ